MVNNNNNNKKKQKKDTRDNNKNKYKGEEEGRYRKGMNKFKLLPFFLFCFHSKN